MKQKKNSDTKKGFIYGVSFVIGGALGGAAGFFGTKYLDENGASGMDWVGLFLAIVAAIYLQIIIHEAGHLIFGLLTGYKFVSFRVGSFIVYKKQGKIHCGRYSLAGTGGQCLMAAPDMVDGKMPYRLYNFGGALLNVIVSALAAVIWFVCDLGLITKVFFVAMIGIGVLFAITNGVPMRMGGIDNDGYNALSLGKTPNALYSLWLQLKVNEMLVEGKRLKDLPEEWFKKPAEEEMQNSMIAALEAIRCNRLMDAQAFKEVSQAIDEITMGKNGMVGVQKMLLQIDQIYCECIGEKRENILKQMEEKEITAFVKSMKTFPSVLRTQYAYALLIENDKKKAESIKKQFEKVMKKHPYEGEVESEWELIRLCENTELT